MANIQKRPAGRWLARYRDDAGQKHAKHVVRKLDANAGSTRSPPRSSWTSTSTRAPARSPSAYVEGVLRRHVYPIYGSRPIGSILPSEIQAWVKLLGTGDQAPKRKPLAPATVGVIHGVVSGICRSATRDRRIIANPCQGTRLARDKRRRIMPLTTTRSRPYGRGCSTS